MALTEDLTNLEMTKLEILLRECLQKRGHAIHISGHLISPSDLFSSSKVTSPIVPIHNCQAKQNNPVSVGIHHLSYKKRRGNLSPLLNSYSVTPFYPFIRRSVVYTSSSLARETWRGIRVSVS